MKIVHKTPEELQQIAQDLHSGLIYTHGDVPEDMDREQVFLVLAWLNKEQVEDFNVNIANGDVGLIYEYLNKAKSKENGQPTFITLRTLTTKEYEQVLTNCRELKKAS